MLSVANKLIMMSVMMLNVVMMSAMMLNVVMLSFAAPKGRLLALPSNIRLGRK
jgi:hypothetical protein